ncbi:MAG: hypothetical protein ACKVVP_10840 [Chloroflexota bacterium]
MPLVALLVSLYVLGIPCFAGRVYAQPEPPCEDEPGADTAQTACDIDPDRLVHWYLDGEDDQDFYVLTVPDFNTLVDVELRDTNAPYRIVLSDWNGRVLGNGSVRNGKAQLQVKTTMPGMYWVKVESETGQYDPSIQYHLIYHLTFPTGRSPRMLYWDDFKVAEACDTFWVGSCQTQGVYSIAPNVVGEGIGRTHGPDVADLTVTLDARTRDSEAGQWDDPNARYEVIVRKVDNPQSGISTAYSVEVRPADNRHVGIFLDSWKTDGEGSLTRVPLFSGNVSAVANADDVQRTAVRVEGNQMWVNINGQEIAHLTGLTHLAPGRFGFFAYTGDSPDSDGEIYFDNLLVSTWAR